VNPPKYASLTACFVAGRQRIECFVYSLADHRGEKSFPGQRPVGGVVVPSINSFLQAPVISSDAAPVEWRPRAPVISHVRQASLAAAGSTMKSASLAGASSCSPPLVSPEPRGAANHRLQKSIPRRAHLSVTNNFQADASTRRGKEPLIRGGRVGRLISSTRGSSAAIASRLSNSCKAPTPVGASASRMYAEAPLANTKVGVPNTP